MLAALEIDRSLMPRVFESIEVTGTVSKAGAETTGLREGTLVVAGAGDILVIKAGEIHEFKCIGDEPLVQVDVHVNPRFIQENL